MPKLQDIAEIPRDAVDLLEALGYLDAEDLPGSDTQELLGELVKANNKLAIMPENPTEEIVEEWKNAASGDSANPRESEQEHEQMTLVEKVDPIVNEGGNPEAVLLNPSLIRRHKLAVGDIPEGILLTECTGEVGDDDRTTPRMDNVQHREADVKRTGLMVSRIRNFDQVDTEDHHVKPLDKGKTKESVSVSEGLNAGLRPESRRFVRGVLHPHPVGVRVSAFFAVLVQLFLAANFIGVPWLLIHEFISGENMLWWVVGLASGLVLSALCYLFWGVSARCRVCGQRQFAPKKCVKNKKAHHIPLIGFIFPTALHTMFFKWFYCTYCGTAVRLKK
jgi:hypothetical protein